MPNSEQYGRWESIAQSYSQSFGKEISPDDVHDYAGQIMSLLSDAQEEMHRAIGAGYFRSRYNDNINAAKLMLCNMKEAVRLKERAEARANQ